MKKQLLWKKGIFSNTYQISDCRKLIGLLKMDALSYKATGEIEGEKYLFKTKGLFSSTINVIHQETKSHIANIKISMWGNKAYIHTREKNYLWKFRNLWQNKWSVSNESNTFLAGTHNGFISKGEIIVKDADNFLILISLYVKNYLIRINGVS